jgi:hypothetical protein
MERPTEMLLARVAIEVINRKNKKAEDGANLKSIEEISAGTVAGWARDRAAALLADAK